MSDQCMWSGGRWAWDGEHAWESLPELVQNLHAHIAQMLRARKLYKRVLGDSDIWLCIPLAVEPGTTFLSPLSLKGPWDKFSQ